MSQPTNLENSGLGQTRSLIQTDQEPAIITVQKAIPDLKFEVVPINSPVGESACNGRVENTIRRVQESMRAIRHHVEKGVGQSIPETSPIMAWMARWVAELFSKYAPGDDGRILYERIWRESCQVPLIPSGQNAMYLPMKTATSSKGEPATRCGIWLGIIERTEEIIIGTTEGVVKCRTISRLANGNQWDKDLLLNMKGLPWEPIPGKQNMHIPVELHDDGEDPERDRGVESKPIEAQDDENPVEVRGSADKLHIFRKAVTKYDMTIGCLGCNDLARRGPHGGKLIYNHPGVCRNRFVEMMESDPEYRRLLEKHGYSMSLDNLEGTTRERMQEVKHQLQRATTEIERKMAQSQRSVKLEQLDRTMRIMLLEQMEVAEVYSRPRIAKMAQEMGLRAGRSLDLTTCDEAGRPWYFNCIKMSNVAVRLLLNDKPRLLIGSPMCAASSTMNNLNYARMIAEEKQERIECGRKFFEFCCNIYELQLREGRYVLHQHPAAARSWSEECINKMLRRQGVVGVVGDQCQCGLKSHDGQREGLARKRVGFMTNSPCIAKRLTSKCPNNCDNQFHKHVVLINGRAKAAETYPPGLCKAVCKGLVEQLEADRLGQHHLYKPVSAHARVVVN